MDAENRYLIRVDVGTDSVRPDDNSPFLAGYDCRTYAAIFDIWVGVNPLIQTTAQVSQVRVWKPILIA